MHRNQDNPGKAFLVGSQITPELHHLDGQANVLSGQVLVGIGELAVLSAGDDDFLAEFVVLFFECHLDLHGPYTR